MSTWLQKTRPIRSRLAALVCVVFAAFALTLTMSGQALAQRGGPPPPTIVLPGPGLTDIDTQFASHQALFDLGSNFLRRAGDQATWGTNAVAGRNAGGGGASESTAPQTFRSWAEAYGISSHNDAQGDFVGDHRKTFGGAAGIAATVLPGLNIGATVDQSDTRIDLPLALQSAKLALTQFGFNANYTVGAWTLAGAVVHGWGMIDAQRDTIAGLALSHYRGRIDGAVGELSYYWGLGESRVVPKLGVEYMRAQTDAFQETGGDVPVAAAAATGERTRVLIGTEVGHYWIIDRHVLDISGYGKFVDNVAQSISPIAVTANGQTVTVAGIVESQYGADAGAGISFGLTNALRMYANYDGKFRGNSTSHQGTLGLEVKW